MTIVLLLALAALFLSLANGANDNFKGVATLFGSGTADYRRALAWATGTTLAGSVTAIFLAGGLLRAFSGKGLVDDSLVGRPDFLLAVAAGSGLTVLVATRCGLPISTTHGLVGALCGAGWVMAGEVELGVLAATFFAPLLLSPLAATALTAGAYPLLRRARRALGVERQSCLCVAEAPLLAIGGVAARSPLPAVHLETCGGERYAGRLAGVDAQAALGAGHYLSAGAVSFARGLNDTPKIAALLIALPALAVPGRLALVGLMMAVGGVVAARRVAETMAHRITPMNHGQGFTANAVTALLVLVASRFGLPVSTTHVSCGALFGLGATTGQARWSTVGMIVLSWVGTLPLATALAAAVALALR